MPILLLPLRFLLPGLLAIHISLGEVSGAVTMERVLVVAVDLVKVLAVAEAWGVVRHTIRVAMTSLVAMAMRHLHRTSMLSMECGLHKGPRCNFRLPT
jgi:hypothetical protein